MSLAYSSAGLGAVVQALKRPLSLILDLALCNPLTKPMTCFMGTAEAVPNINECMSRLCQHSEFLCLWATPLVFVKGLSAPVMNSGADPVWWHSGEGRGGVKSSNTQPPPSPPPQGASELYSMAHRESPRLQGLAVCSVVLHIKEGFMWKESSWYSECMAVKTEVFHSIFLGCGKLTSQKTRLCWGQGI